MGIIKVRLRQQERDPAQKYSITPEADEQSQRNAVPHLPEYDSGDDSENNECAVGSELAVLGNQTFSIPYDMYELPDLKGVLSLEAWNGCLTEEERFSLSAYLPDVDQQTFWLTMNKLLAGENIFFGSPLDRFFEKLKGGLFSLEVARFRECLQILERRKYHHGLSLYHGNMIRVFMDMKKTWSSCQQNTNVEERLHAWCKTKDKPVFSVDLNAMPADEELFIKGEKDQGVIQSLKRIKGTEENDVATSLFPAATSTTDRLPPLTKPRGVLKIKSVTANSTPSSTVQVSSCNSWGPIRRPPKGVLKVKSRAIIGDSLVKLKPMPVLSEHAHAYGRSPFLQSMSKSQMDPHAGSCFIPEVGGVNSCSEFPVHSKNSQKILLNQDSLATTPWKHSLKSNMYHGEASRGAYQHVDLNRQSTCLPVIERCLNSTEAYPFVQRQHFEGERDMMTPFLSAIAPRVQPISKNEHGTFLKSSVIDSRHVDFIGRSKPSEFDVSGITRERDDVVFPITYKRKKGSLRQSTSNSSKQKIMQGNYDSRVSEGANHLPAEKVKPVRIKLKLWNK